MTNITIKDRILEAALHVFSERGYERATISEITRMAGANIASVNYYFRSKAELFHEVLLRFFLPLNEARISAVAACDARYDSGDLTLESVVDAIARPLIDLAQDNAHGPAMLRLMLQMRSLPLPELSGFLAEAFDPVHDRVIAVLAHVMADLPRAELVLRYDLARGAMLHTLSDMGQVKRRIGREGAADLDMTGIITGFVTGGLRGVAVAR